ncbi:MAG: DUF5916 domain-containing protein [Gemmatimonadaceae bacterium]
MLLSLVLLIAASDPATVYNGRQGQLQIQAPRVEADAGIDGNLSEAVWQGAALLTGFSQFSPADGQAAQDSTEVLVWYSPTAIYFGIRAYEAHGSVHATLADRDRIFSDDNVQLYLGTFNDGRQAMVIGVNPFGVQSDGTINETGQRSGGSFGAGGAVARESADLSPDFVFQSKGRLTEYGFEVEIRIPFKSLRYQTENVQNWGINVTRKVQHSGHEDSWVPAKRAAASFLAQSGAILGLTELRRGLVLDLNPVVTSRNAGFRTDSGFERDGGRPEFGGNVRWGVTNNLTLNGTVNPDFSQVEADAGQFTFDPRSALFFSEKRPFFLDGIEHFNTPSNLIYTRRISQPVAAAKLTGKISGTGIALLSAVDDRSLSLSGEDHPVFNILRVQRDLGAQSRFGVAYTDRIDGDNYNRVADIDSRVVFRKIYSVQAQLAGSWTKRGTSITSAPLWDARFSRNGRRFGFRYTMNGIHPDFRTQSGFISRPGIAHANFNHRFTTFGERGSLVESFTGEVVLDGIWQYRKFTTGGDMQDKKLHFNANWSLRGGWHAGGSVLVETFGYDPAFYSSYAIQVPTSTGLDTIPFTGTPRLPNLDYLISFDTPELEHFSAHLFYLWGKDENFFEWSSADVVYATASVNWRPTDQLRVNAGYQLQQFDRRTDGTNVGRRRIPRLRVEYQMTRAIFFRAIGEYDSDRTDALRDDSRTNHPILIYDAGVGDYVLTSASQTNTFRADWLFSYQPSPGTVFFAGYGSLMQEPEALRFGRLTRQSDGLFVKLSYLYRL